MAANTVLNYLPRKSVIHRLTGTTKLAFFLLFTFASMITYNTWVLLGLLAVSIAAFRLSKIKIREVRFMMIFMLVFLLLNNLFIFLFDPIREPICTAPAMYFAIYSGAMTLPQNSCFIWSIFP